ncbi:hypothetical protein ACIGHN_13385 [Acidovorax sp. NPDC077693]|uniref:hypothetical protein n=1 Tax=unclassified Acidovorax TaxID=2684926 RepID=UPI0037C7E778
MATDTITVKIEVRIAWWVRPYITACALFAALHGLVPNAAKIVGTVARHGIRFKVR